MAIWERRDLDFMSAYISLGMVSPRPRVALEAYVCVTSYLVRRGARRRLSGCPLYIPSNPSASPLDGRTTTSPPRWTTTPKVPATTQPPHQVYGKITSPDPSRAESHRVVSGSGRAVRRRGRAALHLYLAVPSGLHFLEASPGMLLGLPRHTLIGIMST